MDVRQDLIFRAVLAEKAERYEDMIDAINSVAMLDVGLIPKERDLLSVGYKKVAMAKRNSLRALACTEVEAEEEGNENHMKMTIQFRHKVEAELDKLCCNVIDIIDIHLLPYSSDVESKVFYYQMKGDYYRYLAEFKMEPENSQVIDHSLKAYENASNIAEGNLSPAHPIRLGLALNVSIFYYEMLDSPDRACQYAKQAFDDALPNLELLDEQLYSKSSAILQLLMNNLSLWNLNANMDVDAEHTQDSTGRSNASDDSVMNVDTDYTRESKGKSGTPGDATSRDGDAK